MTIDLDELIQALLLNKYAVFLWIVFGFLGLLFSILIQSASEVLK